MTYEEFKNTKEYISADDTSVCINGEEEIDEMYYPGELDFLPVVGVSYLPVIVNGRMVTRLVIDLVCSNWDKRFDVDFLGEFIPD